MKSTWLAFAFLFVAACGSSDDEPATQCELTCQTIEDACSATTADCASDCEDDLERCPTEMQAVIDCVNASTLQCDPEQDQGLAEAPCETEHAALAACGADAF